MVGQKMVPKVILEGTRLTHKTDLAFALNEHSGVVGNRKYRYHSPIVSAEWCGFTNAPWGRGLINFGQEEEAQALETYETWLRMFELQRYYSWIVDRFHISTQAYQVRERQRRIDFSDLEARLSALNFRLIFVTRKPEAFEAARAARLQVSGNPAQYDDLSVFIEEQEAMRGLVSSSLLQTFEVDISDDDVPRAADQIADWLAQTGGLWLED